MTFCNSVRIGRRRRRGCSSRRGCRCTSCRCTTSRAWSWSGPSTGGTPSSLWSGPDHNNNNSNNRSNINNNNVQTISSPWSRIYRYISKIEKNKLHERLNGLLWLWLWNHQSSLFSQVFWTWYHDLQDVDLSSSALTVLAEFLGREIKVWLSTWLGLENKGYFVGMPLGKKSVR